MTPVKEALLEEFFIAGLQAINSGDWTVDGRNDPDSLLFEMYNSHEWEGEAKHQLRYYIYPVDS